MPTNHPPQLPIDGIDTADIAVFLIDALELMRHRHDLADLCTLLTTRVLALLPVAASAVVLTDGEPGPTIASVAGTSVAERQFLVGQLDDSLIRDCLRATGPTRLDVSTGNSVVRVDLLQIASKDVVFGTLVLLSSPALPEHHLHAAVILADVAAVAFLQASSHLVAASSRTRFAELLRSLDVIEQAKGMLAQRHGIGVDAAFDGLWKVALDHGVGLGTLAEQVVNRTLDDTLLGEIASCLTTRASERAE